jgi:hypothetical protein
MVDHRPVPIERQELPRRDEVILARSELSQPIVYSTHL